MAGSIASELTRRRPQGLLDRPLRGSLLDGVLRVIKGASAARPAPERGTKHHFFLTRYTRPTSGVLVSARALRQDRCEHRRRFSDRQAIECSRDPEVARLCHNVVFSVTV